MKCSLRMVEDYFEFHVVVGSNGHSVFTKMADALDKSIKDLPPDISLDYVSNLKEAVDKLYRKLREESESTREQRQQMSLDLSSYI